MGLQLPSGESFPAIARIVSGSVQTPVPGGLRPTRDTWVTLHRVGGGSGRPVDSVRTGADGGYAIRYRRAAQDDAVFFISATHAGITYFSPPLPNADVRGDDADLIVYDTTAGPLSLRLRGRHIVVGAVDSTLRRPVVEIFEIGNDSSVTLVASEDRPSWSLHIPERAEDFRISGGDVSPEAVTRDGSLVQLFAPVAPGIKQVSVLYSLPREAFPASIPVTEPVELLEVLVEDGAGSAEGAGLTETDALSVEGRTFRRFVATDVAAAGVLRIAVPMPEGGSVRAVYVAGMVLALGLLMLLALGRSVRRRPAPALAWGAAGAARDPDDLARRIAALDAAFQRRRNPTPDERAEYERQRGGLKAMLTEALVRQGGDS